LERSCPLCGTSCPNLYCEKNGFTILRCSSCGLAFVNDEPSEEEVRKFYRESYLPYHLLYGDFEEKAERRYSLVESAAGNRLGSLLDVGCSYGFFLNVARTHGWAVKGVEMGSRPAEYARTRYGLDVFEGPLQKADFAESSFDVVTLFHVIEHARDPLDLLSTVRRILKKGGSLVMLTPNIESLHSQILGKAWTWLSPPDHLFYFSRRSMGLALRKCGFRAASISSITVDADNLLVQLASTLISTHRTPKKSQVAFRFAGLFRLGSLLTDGLLTPERLFCSLTKKEDEIFAVATKP
jgi:SAM-dependent methyltransferase